MRLISREEVEKIAGLANLDLSSDEIQTMRVELDRILEFVGELDELAVPEMSIEKVHGKDKLSLRDDVVEVCGGDDLMTRAPLRKNRFYVVPKIIEEDPSSGA
jgi:aspartyl-tRNA(Asn)/glutamyl-tRNA(Gln) amidotransferase subunit C